MSEPEFSDSESLANISDLSIGEYSNGDYSNEENNIEIDMDSKPINSNKTPTKKTITKTITKRTVPISTHNIKSSNTKPRNTKSSITTLANLEAAKALEEVEAAEKEDDCKNSKIPIKSKPIARKKKECNNDYGINVDIVNKNDLEVKDVKESVADSKFQLNDETIEYFCKDNLENIKKICVVNSTFTNDTALLCLLLKLNIITEYKCSVKKCKTGKTWLGKAIQLLVHRKNGKMHDLTTSNLELICPNCYISAYGIDLFMKVIANTIYKCIYCGFPLNNFSNSKKKERICMACESRIVSSSYFSKRSEYINELKDTIDEASQLKKDEFVQSNYYSEVSRYKSFDGETKGTKSTQSKKSNTSTFNDKPIIKLNLSVPTIDELINDPE